MRVVPGASARFGAYLAPGVVMMPSYVNIGAYVDEGTMVDTWATVASCAQIGKRVHLSGGVGIGGVLEPPQAVPVVVEDDCFIGSRCMIVDGARVRQGAKLGAGVIVTSSTPVIDAQTGDEVGRGDIPERAVVVQGIRNKEFPGGTFGLPCALDPALPRRGRGARQADAERDPARARHRLVTKPAVTELLDLTEQLCAIPSVSGTEGALADFVEQWLREHARCARDPAARATTSSSRTGSGAGQRVVLGGHLDTVPAEREPGPEARRRRRCTGSAAPT